MASELTDPENPEWTDEMFAAARPAKDALPPRLYQALTARQGRPLAEPPKTPLSIRIDADVVAYFRSSGAGWQTRINALLRQAMEQAKAS